MSFVDDLRGIAESAVSNVQGNVQDYLTAYKKEVSQSLVKVGQAASGNLTALELAQGKVGTPEPVAPPSNLVSIAQNALAASSVAPALPIGVLLAVGLGAYLIFRRG